MRSQVAATVVVLLTCGLVGRAAAQATAHGNGFGATLSIGGSTIIDASDTGTGSAPHLPPNQNNFDKTASGAQIPVPPLIEVITGESRTRGCVNPAGCPAVFPPVAPADSGAPTGLNNELFVRSRGGDAVAAVLVGQAPGGVDVLQAATSGSDVTIRCNNDGATLKREISGGHPNSEVDLLVIAGTPIPLNKSPNTTVIVPGLPLVVMNEQDCHTIPAGSTSPTGITCFVNALHAQILPDPPVTGGSIVDVKLSHADATLDNFFAICGGVCEPLFTNSKKRAEVLNPDGSLKASGIPSPGDKIRFTVEVVNSSGCATATNLKVIDRIPQGVTFDTGSTQIQTCPSTTPECTAATTPIAGTVNDCDPSLQFQSCTGEPASDDTRQCLTVADGDVPPNTSKNVIFTVTVDSGATPGGCDEQGFGNPICNQALIITDQNASNPVPPGPITINCPNGPPTGTPTPGGTPTPPPMGGGSGSGIGGGGGLGGVDTLHTFGGGGCALGANSHGVRSEVLPVLIAGVWLGLRQWRKRRSRR